MNIGTRIKELRKQNGLTQEKLADFLCVSYQAVSKWECGLSSPDLSLIVPLARLLHVSTDTLLGAEDHEADDQRARLEQAYHDTFQNGDMAERMRITEEAVRACPGDMLWLNRLAWDIWCRNIDQLSAPDFDEESFEAERERAIKLFDTVIRNTEDDAVKANAITGIVQCLCGKGSRAEAREYVELYPVKVSTAEKQHLLGGCLEGEARVQHKQKELDDELGTLVRDLLWYNGAPQAVACPVAKAILEAMIPDGNYGHYHHEMSHIHFRLAEIEAKAGRASEALRLLEQAALHANAYDDIDTYHRREYRLTAPLFDHLICDSRVWARTGDETLFDDIRRMTRRKSFDALRDQPAFQALFGKD